MKVFDSKPNGFYLQQFNCCHFKEEESQILRFFTSLRFFQNDRSLILTVSTLASLAPH